MPEAKIDARAVVEPGAVLGHGVTVGPFSVIGSDVKIGDDTWIGSHVVITGNTVIGSNNRIYHFCSLGEAPQHTGYRGEATQLHIGNDNTIREYCTLNRGTVGGGGVTTVGNSNFLMAYVHIAHDCKLGNNTIFANCASLAGHVSVGDHAILGGFTLVHQFCRVGAHCITGIGSVCLQDVPPFVVAAGNRAVPHGINTKGLRRRDFSDREIRDLKAVYKLIYRSNNSLRNALDEVERQHSDSRVAMEFVEFIRDSSRGVIR